MKQMETALESLQLGPAAPLGFAALPSDLTAEVVQLAAPRHLVLTASRELFGAIESRRVKIAWINTLCKMKTPAAARKAYKQRADFKVRTNLCAYLELGYLLPDDPAFAKRAGLDALVLMAASCLLEELQPALNRAGDRVEFRGDAVDVAQTKMANEVKASGKAIRRFTSVPTYALVQLIVYAAGYCDSTTIHQLLELTTRDAAEVLGMLSALRTWAFATVKCADLPWRQIMNSAPDLGWRGSLATFLVILSLFTWNGPTFLAVTTGRLRDAFDMKKLKTLCATDPALRVAFENLEQFSTVASNVTPVLDWILERAWPEGRRVIDNVSLWMWLSQLPSPELFAHVAQHHTKALTDSFDLMFAIQFPSMVALWCDQDQGLHALGVIVDHGLLDSDAWGRIALALLQKGPDTPASDPLVQLAVERLGRNNGAKLIDVLRDFGLFTLEGKDHTDEVLAFAHRYFGDNEDLIDMLEIIVASEKPKRALRRRARFAAMFVKSNDPRYLPPLAMRACCFLDQVYWRTSPADQDAFDWDGYEALAWLPVAIVNDPNFARPLLSQIGRYHLAPVLLGIMIMAQAAGRVGRHVLPSTVNGKTCGDCDLAQQVEWASAIVTLLRFADNPTHGPVLPDLPRAAKKCLADVLRKYDAEGRPFAHPEAIDHGKGRCGRATFDMMPFTLGIIEQEQPSSFLDDVRREFA
ncbi:hypothetical protein H9P43_006467 [Blastocladiella emersonii ATCC 22665]|nr:hypothetical protein H9P43_006467 [Blastocladiella emersonii ATCC 22665]